MQGDGVTAARAYLNCRVVMGYMSYVFPAKEREEEVI